MMPKFAYKIVIQRVLLTLAFLSLLSLVPQSNVSAGYDQQGQLIPSDPAAANEMGYAMVFSDTKGIVGVPGDADAGLNSGSAYIWHYNGANSIWEKETKLTAPDAGPGDRFGTSVAMRDQYAMVGAPNWNGGQGAVYIYRVLGSESWPLYAILTADDGATGDEFGASISAGIDSGLSGTRIAVGAPGKGAGAVYLFEAESGEEWEQVGKITSADGAAGDRFGASVYTDTITPGGFTIVGSPNDDDAGDDSGSVYVYVPSGGNTWAQETKLNGIGSAAGDHFGMALKNMFRGESNITLMVGAPDADSPATDAGAVYTFKRNNAVPSWSQEEKLTANDAAAGDHFGSSLAHYIDQYAAIGAPGDDDKGADAGAAYVFSYAFPTWAQVTKLTGTESAAGDNYGASVAIGENLAMAGAPLATGVVGQAQSGAIHVHNRLTSWSQSARLTTLHNPINDSFASSFAIDGNYAIVGAYGDDDGGYDSNLFANAGAAYIYFKNGGVWGQQIRLTSSDKGRATQFGNRVAISGNTALISTQASTANAIFAYVRNGTEWAQQARLVLPTGPSGNITRTLAINGDHLFTNVDNQRYFYKRTGSNWALQDQFSGAASSVAMDGNWAAIGNPASGTDGAVDIYFWNGSAWVLTKTLTPAADSSSSTMSFGYSVAVNGTTIAVGAIGYSETGLSAIGAVYTYTYNGTDWVLQQLLKRTNATQNIRLGTSLSIEGSRILAGMSAPTTGNEQAIMFRNLGSGWVQVQSLTRSTNFEDYGHTVVLENGEAWVTAPLQAVSGATSAGSVYAYQYTPDADLTVELLDIPGWIAGFDMTYKVTVTNNGQEDTTGVSIVDTLPANVTFLSASAGCSPVANVVTCAVGNLNIGESETVFIDVNINGAATGVLTNGATVTSALPDSNTADNTATQQTQIVPAPGVPTPLTPADGSTTTNTTPTFTWTPVSGIFYYDVQLDIMDPPEGYYSGFNVGETFKPPAPLLYMTYYWRVRSVDEFDVPSPWSDTFVLIVNAGNTVAPIRTVSQDVLPTVSWSPVTWATAYQVEIAADSKFETVVLPSGELPPTATSYTSLDELPNGTWYWRVRARKEDGVTWSAWSTVETLQVIVP